jgi:serine/threonine protein kinase
MFLSLAQFLRCCSWILMEHMDSGSLTSLITKFQIPEPLIAYVCREVCQGLQYAPALAF